MDITIKPGENKSPMTVLETFEDVGERKNRAAKKLGTNPRVKKFARPFEKLIELGYIEQNPRPGGRTYAITDKGWRALDADEVPDELRSV